MKFKKLFSLFLIFSISFTAILPARSIDCKQRKYPKGACKSPVVSVTASPSPSPSPSPTITPEHPERNPE